jgi:hypothetical protein
MIADTKARIGSLHLRLVKAPFPQPRTADRGQPD